MTCFLIHKEPLGLLFALSVGYVNAVHFSQFFTGVWKSGKPESGIGNGIGIGTGTGTGIGTGMGRKTYIKIGTTFTLI